MIVHIVYFSEDVLSEAPLANWTFNHVWLVTQWLLTCNKLISRCELILGVLLLDCLCEVPLSQIYDRLFVFIEGNLTDLSSRAWLTQIG